MSQSVVGALRVTLGLDSAQFSRGTTQVQRRLSTMRRQFVAVAGTVAALGAALTTMALRGAADIDRIVKAARRIDGSTGAFQALELAAGEAGVSLSSLTNDIQTMNRELARNSAGAQRSLQRLGLSAQELTAMDADERLAAIADRVRDLGLSAGEATALLRDLGIRNREMALLLLRGGDAIRSARDDVRDYGLEVDEAMGARIEQARDNISRLGVVTQYFGQRLAAEVVPALGAFAQAITDSMREGGALRAVVDGLVNNLQLLATIAGVAVVAFGTRYVAALVAARVATLTLTGALVALRTALMRTGIGALIVGTGVLIDYMVRLRQAGATWGESLRLLGDVAVGTFRGIVVSGKAIQPGLEAVWHGVRADFLAMLDDLSASWGDWIGGFIPALDAIRYIPGPGGAAGVAADYLRGFQARGGFSAASGRARADQSDASARASAIVDIGFHEAREAVSRLNEVLSQNGDMTTDAADAARALAAELDEIAGTGGGGGGARGAANGIDDLIRATDIAAQAADNWGQRFTSHLDGIITSGRTASDVLRSMAKQLESSAWQMLGSILTGGFGGGGGGWGGSMPSFEGGGFTGYGARTGGLDGRGGFLAKLHPNETVIDHTKGGGGAPSRVVVELRSEMLSAMIAEGSAEVVQAQAPGAVNRDMAKGGFDRTMGGRFGERPKRIRR